MSGLAGIFYLDGRSAPRADLLKMLDAIAHRGPNDLGVSIQGSVGLGHRMVHTTPESLREKLPFTHSKHDVTITADARLDNRKELLNLLDVSEAVTDSELILAAYLRWGDRCVERLL